MAMKQPNPIHSAIQKGFFQQIRFYIDQGYDVNSHDVHGFTPLILCSVISDEKWSVGLARLLLENGAQISKCDKEGYNALHHACINQKEKLVDVYLSAMDCDIHSRCKKGNTSLHYAALFGNLAIVKLLAKLLIRYKQNLDPKNKKGLTPLHQAWKSNNLDCGDLLANYGADVTILDPENKTGSMLRAEAVERLDLIDRLSRVGKGVKTVRKIKKEAVIDRPKTASTVIMPAKSFDQRNDPEYVFHISAIDYFQQKVIQDLMKRPKTSKSSRHSDKDWKEELLRLWQQYEIQNSKSFRRLATPMTVTPTIEFSRRRSSSQFSSIGQAPNLNRRNSRMSIKSRTGSMSSFDAGSRKPSMTPRRSGMPHLVRTQSRASFSLQS